MKKSSRIGSKKPGPSLRDRGTPLRHAGTETLKEIMSQPAVWVETARRFAGGAERSQIARIFSPREPWLFVACGSSYYLSRTIAAEWTKLLKIGCTGVPASELFFAPEETLQRTGAKQIVLISRSGKTTEVLRVAEFLSAREGTRTLGITCSADSDLQKLCTLTLQLPWADEKSMVMTRSFTSILLLFARLAANFAGDMKLEDALDRLPERTEAWLGENADKIRALGARRSFADFVFLGQGSHFWLAQEAALKLMEMSSSYAQAYHTLEFRHGPKSIASRDTLIAFLLSDSAAEEESLLVGELKKLGAATMIVANHAKAEMKRESDLLVELGLDEPEFARMAMTAIPAQLLGFAVGLRKGLNPDTPKNLTRAVVLASKNGAPTRRSRD